MNRLVRLCFLLILLWPALPCLAETVRTQHILILNSYHKGHYWTDEQTDGMQKVLRQVMPDAVVDLYYLDWKRFPFQATLDEAKQLLGHRYKGRTIDLILTTDDAALLFALKNRSEIFANAPIVYSGVFENTAKELTRLYPDMTGVYETVDIEGTIGLAIRANPAYKQVVIVHDDSESSIAFRNNILAVLDKQAPQLKRSVLSGMPFEALRRKLAALPNDSFVLLSSYARDSNGLVMQTERFTRLMSEASSAPIYALHNHLLGAGIVGGSLLSGQLQGEASARLGLLILKGNPASSLLPINKKTVIPGFEYAQLTRFNIPRENLPANAKILGKPFSFLETYRRLVLSVGFAFVLLTGLVVVLFTNIQRRKHAETALRERNDELAASREEYREINEQLEQRVEARTRELELANRDLAHANEELGEAVLRLHSTREQLVEQEKLAALGNLVAGFAHELNTPIGNAVTVSTTLANNCNSFSKLFYSEKALHRSVLDNFIQDALYGTEILHKTLERAAALIGNFKQIAVDRSNTHRRKFDLAEVIEAEATVLRVELKRHWVQLETDIPHKMQMDSYPGILGQILTNLVQNAMLHGLSERTDGVIKIEAHALDNDKLSLSVSDNGLGMSKDVQKRIFEPFFTTRMGRGGSGLGLHIVHNLVHGALGGKISVESDPGQGSCFTLILPCSSPESLPASPD